MPLLLAVVALVVVLAAGALEVGAGNLWTVDTAFQEQLQERANI